MTKKAMTQYDPLDEEEKEIIDALEHGKFKRSKNAKSEIAAAKAAATHYLKKDMKINIRLSSSDLSAIKGIAAYEGIPYQTLISSLIHKYAAGHFK